MAESYPTYSYKFKKNVAHHKPPHLSFPQHSDTIQS